MTVLRKPLPLATAVVALMLAVSGCQLFVDLDGLEDHSCPPNWKSCPDGCARFDDPSHGCGNPATCNPCPAPHAVAACDEGYRCSLRPNSCLGDWADCDGVSNNGCETDLAHSPIHCGVCRKVCEPAPLHGVAGCSDKKCAISRCLPGWEDCDRNASTGCETPIGGPEQCVTCCPEGSTCELGVCVPISNDG